MDVNNILPFYKGQKVVCVRTHEKNYVVKGKIYEVLKCYFDCCGEIKVQIVGIDSKVKDGVLSSLKRSIRFPVMCQNNKHIILLPKFHPFDFDRFVPYREQKMKILTFKEIRAEEIKEILLEN